MAQEILSRYHHSGMLKRARERYEREVAGPDESRRKPSNSPQVNYYKTGHVHIRQFSY